MEHKIFGYIDQIEDVYNGSITLIDGLTFNHRDVLRTIEYYSNNEFLTGKYDSLGREKPFYNVCNYRVTTAKVATDLDVKDIKYESDSLTKADIVATMLINRELFKYLKESNFSKTLNDMGLTRPKYGGLLIKRYSGGGDMTIDVVDWKNATVDPVDIMGGAIIETHYMSNSEFMDKQDVWENVDEVIDAHKKANKHKPVRIEVKEITGTFPEEFDPEADKDAKGFKTMCFYIACVGEKKYYLYKEDLKDIDEKYKYLAWERIPGRGLGRGVVEDGFQSQVWINDAMISIKNAMDLSGKVILSTTSKKVSGNAITGVDNGHIFELEEGKTISSLNLAPSALPQFQNTIELWNQQYDRASSTYNANTGEAPTAGTPYSQTALLNQVANSPFEYQREVWGIFLNEVLNDWILPHLKKRILKSHTLVSEFSEEELKMIDEAFVIRDMKKMIKENLAKGVPLNPADLASSVMNTKTNLAIMGTKRQVEIPEKALDIEGRITANITGELRNKAAILASLDNIFKTVASTFNPNTGEYAALQDPVLSKIFAAIVEMSGVPVSFAQLNVDKASNTLPTPQADQSAVSPISPIANGTPAPATV